jgi:hypothetical protein
MGWAPHRLSTMEWSADSTGFLGMIVLIILSSWRRPTGTREVLREAGRIQRNHISVMRGEGGFSKVMSG